MHVTIKIKEIKYIKQRQQQKYSVISVNTTSSENVQKYWSLQFREKNYCEQLTDRPLCGYIYEQRSANIFVKIFWGGGLSLY